MKEARHVPASSRSALPNSLVGARRTCQCRAPVSTRGYRGREGRYARIRLDLLEAGNEVHVFWPVHGRPFPELGTGVEDGEEDEVEDEEGEGEGEEEQRDRMAMDEEDLAEDKKRAKLGPGTESKA